MAAAKELGAMTINDDEKMDMRKRQQHHAGFTLVEIIAVLVLIGILSAVAVPKFMDISQAAKQKNPRFLTDPA